MPEISTSYASPSILAPAGSRDAFLAALAAGADAVYCGFKQFSARSEAKNFTVDELIPLVRLAREEEKKVYIALNSILKPGDLESAGKLVDTIKRFVKPDGLIVQDIALLELSKLTGYSGEIHLSTLANVSFSEGLKTAARWGVDRVVVPRELSVEEIKAMAKACPKGLGLEVFIHGALCYGISGRCYWSSYLGGKSGLRGRCVQPCRRWYGQNNTKERYFSCLDLHLDVLVKALLPIFQIRAWKIEGRKKGAHYVYHTVKAYRILRDLEKEPQHRREAKNEAMDLLACALGRKGTHYTFLPQRPHSPIEVKSQSSSGLFLGRTKGTKKKAYLVPREPLLSGDVLRIGYEDEPWHYLFRIRRSVPRQGRLYLEYPSTKTPATGTPVFLTDRSEPIITEAILPYKRRLEEMPKSTIPYSGFKVIQPKTIKKASHVVEMDVYRNMAEKDSRALLGIWLDEKTIQASTDISVTKIWWWLPPVIWPETETIVKNLINTAQKRGSVNFVLNAPWQMSFFNSRKRLNIWAGPFCNISNAPAVKVTASAGFKGVIVSPELGKMDYKLLAENSILPLGIILSGNWPYCISRCLVPGFETERMFTSPKGEQGWVTQHGGEYWIYPNWRLDIADKRNELTKAGYRMFVNMVEPIPSGIGLKDRPGMWNWDIGLK